MPQPPHSETAAAYFSEIEQFFAVMRMGGFSLSVKDLETARTWYEEGVPLEVVIRGVTEGVKDFFSRSPAAARPPHRLAFYSRFIKSHIRTFRQEMEDQWHELDRMEQFLRLLISEMELLVHCEVRPLELRVKQDLLSRLQGLLEQILAREENLTEGSLAHALLLLDAEIPALYHRRMAEIGEVPTQEDPEQLRAGLGVPDLRFWRNQA